MDGCILVQADQTAVETEFLLQLAEENSFIQGVVGWVDLRSANITALLTDYSKYPKLKGFRHVLQNESPEFMLAPDFINGLAALQPFGFTYDMLVYPEHLPVVLQLLKQFPEQAFVIDHLAKPSIKDRRIDNWETNIRAIAAHENVYCKISGMVTEADWKEWKTEDFTPFLDIVTESFGTGRLMYGSDWPVCLLAASYGEIVGVVRNYFSGFSETEQAAVFGNNANGFYHLS
jgi:L-fuconolactonase